ncbi:MAG: hypothetical protein ABW042_06140, partial [Phenylobacterium sp.]
MDPALWPLAADPSGAVQRALAAAFEPPEGAPPELWMLAEEGARIAGVAHAMFVPPPPIYAITDRPALFLDDSFAAPGAPAGAFEALLAATEAELVAVAATSLLASCLIAAPERSVFEAAGYEQVTLYMGNSGLAGDGSDARFAEAADLPA